MLPVTTLIEHNLSEIIPGCMLVS